MKQGHDETAIDFLRRLVGNLGYEYEDVVQSLPTINAILDWTKVLAHYDVETQESVYEGIEEGAAPAVFAAFLAKHHPNPLYWPAV